MTVCILGVSDHSFHPEEHERYVYMGGGWTSSLCLRKCLFKLKIQIVLFSTLFVSVCLCVCLCVCVSQF